MFMIFREEKIITIWMLVFLAVSILMRLLLGAAYQRLIKETDNMSATKNKLLKQCKVKFANCYQLNNGVANIPIFVDKFLNKMSVGPISFQTIYHLSGQTMLLSVVCAGIGICKSILAGRMLGEILPFYIASFMGLYLYFSVSTVLDIKGKRRVLKINLVDYLENHLSARIQVTEQDIEMLYGNETSNMGIHKMRNGESRKRKSRSEDDGIRTVELMPIGNRTAASEEVKNKAPQEEKDAAAITAQELEELLQEFLMV